jgi:hypothetical protein
MKLNKILTLTAAFLLFSIIGFAQVEQEEAPMFGTTRTFTLNPALLHNFGEISGTIQSFQFKIKNTGKTILTIKDITIPEKIGVTVLSKTIQPGEDGVIIATVDPTILKPGQFSEKIIVRTEQEEPGILTQKDMTFTVSGTIK